MVSCSAAPDNVDKADDFDDFEDFDNMMKGYLRLIRRGKRITCVMCYDVMSGERERRKHMVVWSGFSPLAGWLAGFPSVTSRRLRVFTNILQIPFTLKNEAREKGRGFYDIRCHTSCKIGQLISALALSLVKTLERGLI
jgi:hypothetical protein